MKEQFRMLDERIIDYLDRQDAWSDQKLMELVFYTKTCSTPQEAGGAAFKRLKRDILRIRIGI